MFCKYMQWRTDIVKGETERVYCVVFSTFHLHNIDIITFVNLQILKNIINWITIITTTKYKSISCSSNHLVSPCMIFCHQIVLDVSSYSFPDNCQDLNR